MERSFRIVSNVIFCIQVLMIFLLLVEERIALPAWLQVAGRMHPLILHLPIGMLILVAALTLFGKQFDVAHNQPVVRFILLFASLSASVTALFGFFLSLQGDYTGNAMTLHKYAGVALSWLCYGLVLVYQLQFKRALLMAAGGLSFALLIAAGHTGAVLTHGENFLLEPLKGPEVKLTAENASAYDYAIKPILEAKCFSCHNETKAKGKLVMTDRNRFMAGGENGSPWVAGKPDESRMIKALHLPLESDEHMPPDGKAQLTPTEIAALMAWVRAGADFDKKVADFPKHDSLRIVVASLFASMPAQPTERVYAFTSASEANIGKVNTPFVTVAPVYQGSPALQADFYVRKGFDIKSLNALTAVTDQLVSLSLSKMPVADKDLSVVSKFVNLELLNLNFTDVKGPGLASLVTLKHLQSLSLASTAISARDLDAVLKLPELRHLFVWNTNINAAQRDSIVKKYPAVTVALTQFSDDRTMRLNRPAVDGEGVLASGSEIAFRHPMNGVTIRYTTDGSKADSVTGQLYDRPITIDKTTLIKAVACKNGWYCSDPVEQILFVRGKNASEVTLLKQPDPLYPGEGAASLSDGRKGIADVLKEPSWLGYQKQPFEALFRFDKANAPRSEVVVSYGQSIYSHCFPPQSVELWGGNDANALHLIRKVEVQQPSNYVPVKVDRIAVPLDGNEFSYYKVVATPIPKLPTWFSKKGEKGWVFVDEVFFY
ncbi:FN3 associated domain-containing protein [Chryseolinea sp. T2]|uniref:FN3 associated domain-containing protein n=1 Tax=Chryseolinea sp. T2 TaxID=3129255 RepID=UPI0030769ADB